MNKFSLSILSLSLCYSATFGQSDNEFWFVVPEVTNTHADRPILLRLSAGALASTVTIEMPANTAGFNGGSPLVINIPANTSFSQDLTTWINILESGNPLSNVVENKGLHITATENITVYYDEMGIKAGGIVANPEIFVLKGSHALGTRFYTPFQNLLSNGSANSAFDIVATEDNTTITITPAKAMVGHAAGVAYSIVLNKGQTYSGQALGTNGAGHLSGTLITSDKNIAVTIKDDSVVQSTSRDLLGDQIVPVDILGTNYIVVKGLVNILNANTGDRAVICATEDGTTITIGGVLKTTLNAGQTYNYQVTLSSEYIETSHPAYVYHVSGFGNELGGALLPPIFCTGSRDVSVFRDTQEPFYLNIMVKNGGQNSFTIKNNTTGITSAIPAGSFSVVPGTPVAGDWYSAQILYSTTDFPTLSNSVISNSTTDFHLALINGFGNTGARYGYFSDFGKVDPGTANILPTPICYNTSDTINLSGSSGSIQWQSSPDGLNNWTNVVGGSGATTASYITPNLTTKTYYRAEVTKGTCPPEYSDTVSVNINPLPVFDLGSDKSICADGSKATFDAGAVFSNYLWNTGENTKSLSTSIAGKHKLTVTDANGCVSSDSVNLIVNALPVFDLGSDKIICADDSVKFDAVAVFSNYTWNTGESTVSIFTSSAGKHKLTVTDTNGCVSSDSANLVVNALPVFDLGSDKSICADGSKATFDAGAVFSNYAWNSGENTKSISTLISGKHKLTVTDVNGCVSSDSVNLVVNALPVFDLGNDTSICADGSKATFDAGAVFSNYAWNSGENTKSIFTSISGKHKLVVTDINGCVSSDSVNLVLNALPVFDLGSDKIICASDSVKFDAVAVFSNYAWNTGESTISIFTSLAGKYKLTVTDTNGCISSDSANLVVNALPVFDLGSDKSICADGSKATFDAGVVFSNYLWNSGENTKSISTLLAGKHKLTVTDLNGCVSSDSVNLIVNTLPVFNLGSDTSICADAIGVVFDAGAVFSIYLWNSGENTKSITTLTAGKHKLTVTDTNGCVASDSVNLIVNALPEIYIGPDVSVCEDQGPVQFTIATQPGYAFLWNNGVTSNSISASTTGLYIVTVSNEYGCANTDSIWLEVKNLPDVDMGPDIVICETSVPVYLNAGADMDSYLWNTGEGTQKISINNSGTYSVAVTKNGCEKSTSVNVLVETLPKVNLQEEYFVCDGEEAEISVQTDGAKILWSNGDTTATAIVNNDGNYSVNVSNGLACLVTDSTKVTYVPFPDKIKNNSFIHCFREDNILTISAETNADSYKWFDGSNKPIYYASKGGFYDVQLISSYGCITYDSIYVDEICSPVLYVPNTFTPNGDGTNETFFALSSDPLIEFQIQIFDRWGELLFEAKDINDAWDGIYRGRQAQIDVYVWKINYKYISINGIKDDSKFGHINLIR